MKAIAQQRYGSTDTLEYTDVPVPEPGADGVLIRVRTAGMDPSVWHLMTGTPLLARLALGLRAPRLPIRGWDVAGVVERVGPRVTRLRPGDEVFGTVPGSFAEFACAPEKQLVVKPAELSWEQAAALPTSGMTALDGLRRVGRIQAGQQVLILGAGGGVGHLAVQLATHFGAHVTGVCSTSKADFVRGLGAERVIDYTRESLTGTYDLILDMAGARPIAETRRLLTATGTLVLGGGEDDGRWFGPSARSLHALYLNPFTRQRLVGLLSLAKPETLRALADLVTTGAVLPHIDRTFALSEVAAAVDHLVTAHPKGKIVLAVS
ncbi:NAD(P)-dependent alcohol dehydrogenase [Nocardia sp. 2]|uniref:NAD(P)-dependent alcohol dehydrogenase n=1 Tax=Nocardia acididurans TaxID=2802282 RepID=A0ABS1M1S4_9NOCA|nr:NAD(P)-dependent alcohol dehydrogenase [Nocardia acididurans]MBL1074025.1 NAD(P)-dependent alcohol dehydrogenase [Nocardia acididurans]